MSTSLDNFTSLTDLLERTDPRAYRLLVLRSHYRSPIEVSPATIADAERALARLDSFARRFELPALGRRRSRWRRQRWERSLTRTLRASGRADERRPQHARRGGRALRGGDGGSPSGRRRARHGAQRLAQSINVLFGAMGLESRAGTQEIDEASAQLVLERDIARAAKNWSEADRLRDELVERGWIVEDGSSGTVIRRP